jgi:hypothetical protein
MAVSQIMSVPCTPNQTQASVRHTPHTHALVCAQAPLSIKVRVWL